MKAKLLEVIDQGREREAELEALVVDKPASADGTWNVKDHLAHVSWWRWRSVQTLNGLRTSGKLPPPVADDDDGAQNAVVYAENKDRTAAAVKADARESWAALRKAVEESSEQDLATPHPERKDTAAWEAVPGAVGHSGTHVWSCLLAAGQEQRAMDVARWSAGVEGMFFTTPDKLADSRYNLACVFGRLGKGDDAVPLLRDAFAANPDLKRWAQKDADLDRIRDEPAVKELLAT